MDEKAGEKRIGNFIGSIYGSIINCPNAGHGVK